MVDIIVAMMDCGGCLLLRLCILQLFFFVVPPVSSEGFSFYVGGLGVEVCSRCPQP